MPYALVLAGLGLVTYIVGSAVYQYRKTPGTSILTAFWGSLTILWTRALALSTTIIALAATFAEYLGDPSIADAIKSVVKPEYVPFIIVGIAFLTEWARRKSLKNK